MRINCIDVELLADQHLRAEWVEMLMLPAFIKRSQKTKRGVVFTDKTEYTLNKGHATFFYNKLTYVQKRYKQLEMEMKRRGFQANPSLDLSMFGKEYFNDWTPTQKDKDVNIERIVTRISVKPQWYKYQGKQVDWYKFYGVCSPTIEATVCDSVQ